MEHVNVMQIIMETHVKRKNVIIHVHQMDLVMTIQAYANANKTFMEIHVKRKNVLKIAIILLELVIRKQEYVHANSIIMVKIAH
jgi:hypothetical protein